MEHHLLGLVLPHGFVSVGWLHQPQSHGFWKETAFQPLRPAQGWWLTGSLNLSRCLRRQFPQGENLSVTAEITVVGKEM